MQRRRVVEVVMSNSHQSRKGTDIRSLTAALEQETHDEDPFIQKERAHSIKAECWAEIGLLNEEITTLSSMVSREQSQNDRLRFLQEERTSLGRRLAACKILLSRISVKVVSIKASRHIQIQCPTLEEAVRSVEEQVGDVQDSEDRKRRLVEIKASIDARLAPLRIELNGAKQRARVKREFTDADWFVQTSKMVATLGIESQACQHLLGELKEKGSKSKQTVSKFTRENASLNYYFVKAAQFCLDPEMFQKIEGMARNRVEQDAAKISGSGFAEEPQQETAVTNDSATEDVSVVDVPRKIEVPVKRKASRFLQAARALRNGSDELVAETGALIIQHTQDASDLKSLESLWRKCLEQQAKALPTAGYSYVRGLLTQNAPIQARAVYDCIPSGEHDIVERFQSALLIGKATGDIEMIGEARRLAQDCTDIRLVSKFFRLLTEALQSVEDLELFESFLDGGILEDTEERARRNFQSDYVSMLLLFRHDERARDVLKMIAQPAFKVLVAGRIASKTALETDVISLNDALAMCHYGALKSPALHEAIKGLLAVGRHEVAKNLVESLDGSLAIFGGSVLASTYIENSQQGSKFATWGLSYALERCVTLQKLDSNYQNAARELVRALAAYGHIDDAAKIAPKVPEFGKRCVAYLLLDSVQAGGKARLSWEGDH
jgi:hypothetical protein